MWCRPRLYLSTWMWTVALLLITSAIVSNGHEGHHKNGTTGNATESIAATVNESIQKGNVADPSSDYEWHNPDDYQNDESGSPPEISQNNTETPPDQKQILPNATIITVNDSSAAVADISLSANLTESSIVTTESILQGNETSAGNEQSIPASSDETDASVGSDEDDYSASAEKEPENATGTSPEVKSPVDNGNETILPSPSIISTSSSESSSTPQIQSSSESKSDESPTPLPIEYQDAGEHYVNYTTPDFGDIGDNPSQGSRTWAVVIVGLLICFVVLFTLLYFVRGALIRRRKADQRKLLRASSISSEGYFYGDGDEGNHAGKFEL